VLLARKHTEAGFKLSSLHAKEKSHLFIYSKKQQQSQQCKINDFTIKLLKLAYEIGIAIDIFKSLLSPVGNVPTMLYTERYTNRSTVLSY